MAEIPSNDRVMKQLVEPATALYNNVLKQVHESDAPAGKALVGKSIGHIGLFADRILPRGRESLLIHPRTCKADGVGSTAAKIDQSVEAALYETHVLPGQDFSATPALMAVRLTAGKEVIFDSLSKRVTDAELGQTVALLEIFRQDVESGGVAERTRVVGEPAPDDVNGPSDLEYFISFPDAVDLHVNGHEPVRFLENYAASLEEQLQTQKRRSSHPANSNEVMRLQLAKSRQNTIRALDRVYRKLDFLERYPDRGPLKSWQRSVY